MLDLERFWSENAESHGKPFRTDKPRAPISIPLDDHWLLEELQVPSTVKFYKDSDYRLECFSEGNTRCQDVLGISPFPNSLSTPTHKRIEEIFGAKTEVIEGGTPWLVPKVTTPLELEALLDTLESLDDDGLRSRAEIAPSLPIGDGEWQVWTRGPATVASSVLGTEESLMLAIDEPELAERFFHVMAQTIIRIHRLAAASQGKTPKGVGVLDDNCALWSPSMYRRFCFPVWQSLAQEFAKDVAMRYQHSDSAMEHLMPILAELDLTACNFGPTLHVQAIRSAMPRTEIQGQLAPFTLRNGSSEDVEREVHRDWQAVGADGGWLATTAGSVPAGTSLVSILRWMECVDRVCRYQT